MRYKLSKVEDAKLDRSTSAEHAKLGFECAGTKGALTNSPSLQEVWSHAPRRFHVVLDEEYES